MGEEHGEGQVVKGEVSEWWLRGKGELRERLCIEEEGGAWKIDPEKVKRE